MPTCYVPVLNKYKSAISSFKHKTTAIFNSVKYQGVCSAWPQFDAVVLLNCTVYSIICESTSYMERHKVTCICFLSLRKYRTMFTAR